MLSCMHSQISQTLQDSKNVQANVDTATGRTRRLGQRQRLPSPSFRTGLLPVRPVLANSFEPAREGLCGRVYPKTGWSAQISWDDTVPSEPISTSSLRLSRRTNRSSGRGLPDRNSDARDPMPRLRPWWASDFPSSAAVRRAHSRLLDAHSRGGPSQRRTASLMSYRMTSFSILHVRARAQMVLCPRSKP